jgi:rod shape-determining protein MreC
MPILNEKFRIGGSLAENNYTGSVRWSGTSTHHVDLIDLSTYADPRLGMAVEVRSERLPEGILIGHIDDFEFNATQTAYRARLHLAVDISRLDNVIVVENSHYGEIEGLMETME